MPTLYVRVSGPVHDWIVRQAGASGLTMAVVTEAVMLEAMRRGWSVSAGPGVIIKDVQPQATQAPTGVARGAAAELASPPRGGCGPTGDGDG